MTRIASSNAAVVLPVAAVATMPADLLEPKTNHVIRRKFFAVDCCAQHHCAGGVPSADHAGSVCAAGDFLAHLLAVDGLHD